MCNCVKYSLTELFSNVNRGHLYAKKTEGGSTIKKTAPTIAVQNFRFTENSI